MNQAEAKRYVEENITNNVHDYQFISFLHISYLHQVLQREKQTEETESGKRPRDTDRQTDREKREWNTEILFNKAIAPFEGV